MYVKGTSSSLLSNSVDDIMYFMLRIRVTVDSLKPMSEAAGRGYLLKKNLLFTSPFSNLKYFQMRYSVCIQSSVESIKHSTDS